MLIGMICQIFVVPSLFVIFEYLQEKVKPLQFENETSQKVDTEMIQYTRPVKRIKSK